MNNKQKQIHTIDTVFPLIFILLFGFCALALVLSGAHVYQDTTDGLKQNYTIRTAATYLQEKIRVLKNPTMVGLDPSMTSRYPHEFSGGQRQRICRKRCGSTAVNLR